MEIRYKFLEDKELLVQKYIGEPCLIAYKNYLNTITQEEFFSRLKYVITDLTAFKINTLNGLAEKASKSRTSIVSKAFIEVMVVNSPKTTVLATLFGEAEKGPAKFLFCSTFKKAIELLPTDITVDELNAVLQDLKP